MSCAEFWRILWHSEIVCGCLGHNCHWHLRGMSLSDSEGDTPERWVMPGHWPQEARWFGPSPGVGTLIWAGTRGVLGHRVTSGFTQAPGVGQAYPFSLQGIHLDFWWILGISKAQPRQRLNPNQTTIFLHTLAHVYVCVHVHYRNIRRQI